MKCPVYLMAGWHDGYVNAMLRMYTKLEAPKKLLIGPWVHMRPDQSIPGPRIDYLNECCRFFAQHLRGEETGIMDEPAVTTFMQDWVPPDRTIDILPGKWRSDADFPIAGAKELVFYLSKGAAGQPGVLSDQESDAARRETYQYDPSVGVTNRYWSAGMMPYYLAADQREDEVRSIAFTSAPFEHDVQLLGWPRVVLHAASSVKVMTFVAKLSDVAPDGRSSLLSDGSLNGTRRNSLSKPEALEPGNTYELNIPMPPTGWVLKAGHRLRLSVSCGDFPNLWPTPEPGELTLHYGGSTPSRVVLPVVPAAKSEPAFLPSPAPERERGVYEVLSPVTVIHDQYTGRVMVRKENANVFRTWVDSKRPDATSIIATHSYDVEQGNDKINATANVTVRADATHFHIDIELKVTKNGELFFEKKWSEKELRRMM